ncbi:DUF5085 family protein [Streptococcus suis]|nr:DUF5085 family protein [Streptococcus suis]
MKLVPSVRKVDKITHQNVVRKRETFHYLQFEEHFQTFIEGIVDAGYTIKGPVFYSLNNTPLDEMVDIEFFLPIAEGIFSLADYRFSSYFIVGSLIKTRVLGDFNIMTERAYALLLLSLEENNLEINTPFYHVIPSDGSRYVEIFLGYTHEAEVEEEVFGF